MTATSTTRWTCTNCWCAGKITYDSHADAWTVFQKLISAHFAASPDCRFDDDKVRVQLMPAALPDQNGAKGEGRTNL